MLTAYSVVVPSSKQTGKMLAITGGCSALSGSSKGAVVGEMVGARFSVSGGEEAHVREGSNGETGTLPQRPGEAGVALGWPALVFIIIACHSKIGLYGILSLFFFPFPSPIEHCHDGSHWIAFAISFVPHILRAIIPAHISATLPGGASLDICLVQ